MNPENLFLSNLPLIERIAAVVARRNHLTGPDADDFASRVKLRLIEDDYAVFRKFEGRSSLSVYLTIVIQRLLADYRISVWGKWRPSAEARRLGDTAVTLERLIERDGFTFDEAVQIMAQGDDYAHLRKKLEAVYVRLPHRSRRVAVPLEDATPVDWDIDDDPADNIDHHRPKRGVDRALIELPDEIGTSERRGQVDKIGQILGNVITELDPQDRAILQLRFFSGLKVPEIARRLKIDQKKLYKRIGKLLLVLRGALEEQQIGSEDIAAVIAAGDIDEPISRPNVRTIKSADSPGIYVEPDTARRTLKELLSDTGSAGRK
jgi:RNA polymerase sigma factor (sigma-70 family)